MSAIAIQPATAAPDLRAPGRVLLVSCYELGHQPLALATAAGALRDGSMRVPGLDAHQRHHVVMVEQCDECGHPQLVRHRGQLLAAAGAESSPARGK